MKNSHTRQKLDLIFEALANNHRREIIYALGMHPNTASHLAQERGLSLPAIHKHFKILENAQLITGKKIGRTHFFALRRMPLSSLQKWLMQFRPFWGSDAETLENYIQYLKKDSIGGEKK